MKKIIEKEFIRYCIVGIIGGILEIACFYLFNDIFNIWYVIANVLSFIISIVFLYYGNTNYVYKPVFNSKREKVRKFNIFLFTRILGLIFDTAVLALCISVFKLPGLLAKLISCSSSTFINYYVGKLLIFKSN